MHTCHSSISIIADLEPALPFTTTTTTTTK